MISGKQSTVAALLLSRFLPLLLGIVLSFVAAYLILNDNLVFLVPVLFLIPASVLFLHYPFVSILIWLVIYPFFIHTLDPSGRYMYWILHRAMIPGTLVIVIALYMLDVSKKKIRLHAVDFFILIYFFYAVANIFLLTANPSTKLIHFYDRIIVPICIFYIVRFISLTEKDMKWLVPAVTILIWMQTIIGLLSWFQPGMLPVQWLGRAGERTTGTFGNPGVFTTTLLFCAVILIQYYSTSKSPYGKLISFVSIGAAFFMVFLSFSRGSWLGAAIVVAGLLYLYPKQMFRLLTVLFVIFVILSVGFLSFYVEFATERLFTESTAQGRIVGAAATLGMIRDKPIFGWGYGNHELYDEQYRTRVFDFAFSGENSSHNTYLLITAELGIVGILLYLLPAIWLFFKSRKVLPELPRAGFLGRPILFMLWFLIIDQIAVAALTDLIESNWYSTGVWWLILGLIMNIIEPYLRKNQDMEETTVQLSGRTI
ncbi:MAG: O-antigen ligase family protein [Chloroflexi bacterium]|nr:MAG: O-antigen ligase family protein [Chloroflexota bacterium]